MSDAHMEGVRFGELPYLEMNDSVFSCKYSPDGKMLGVGLRNGITYIYNTSTSTILHCLEGHTGWVGGIAFSPDSQRLVSTGEDKTVRVWNITSGEELLVMEGHSDVVMSVAISPCGNRIVSAGGDMTIRMWDAQTGETLFVLVDHSTFIYSVKYSPDGHQLVSGGLDGTIRSWGARTGESRAVTSTLGQVTCVAYSPDGRWVVAGHRGQWVSSGFVGDHLQLWDAVTLEPGPIFSEHSSTVTAIDFSPDGRWIAFSGNDALVKLWDVSTRSLVAELIGHSDDINCVAFSPDGRQIASGGGDKKMRLWEVGLSWSCLDTRGGNRAEELGYSHDGQSILSYDGGEIFRKWDAVTGSSEPISFEMPEQEKITSRAYAPDASQLAFDYEDGSIRLWSCHTGTVGPVLLDHSRQIYTIAFSPCCRWIVSVDEGNTMRLWDLHDMKLRSFLVDGTENLVEDNGGVIFSSTGGQFAFRAEKTICVYDAQSRECLCRLDFELEIFAWTISPNNQQIAIGVADGRIFLNSLRSKEPSSILEGHNDAVLDISYSPCGQWIASANYDKRVEIWHLQSSGEVECWSRVHSIHAFVGPVIVIAWNPVVPMEFLTRTPDICIQVWRMSISEEGEFAIKMVWGSQLSLLCAEDTIFTTAVGLSPIYQKMLAQRGAICPSGEPTFPRD